MKKYLTNQNIFIVILILLSLFVVGVYWPIDGIGYGHDIDFHLTRILGLAQSLKTGEFPFYINMAFLSGQGYAENIFYPSTMLIPVAVLVKNGVNFFLSYKLYLILLSICTGLSMYFSSRHVFKNNFAASISALLYTFSSYRMADMFLRGALGETIAFIFFPIILAGLYEIIFGDYKKNWYIIGIGFAGLIVSHLISAVIMALFVALICVLLCMRFWKTKKRMLYLFLAAVLTIGLTAYFIFPLLEQLLSDRFQFQISPLVSKMEQVSVLGVLNGFTIYGFDYRSIAFGCVLIVFCCLRIFVRDRNHAVKVADFCFFLGIVALFLVTDLVPWHRFPFRLLVMIQFTWRFYTMATLFLAIAAGVYISAICRDSKIKQVFATGIVVIAVTCELSGLAIVYNNDITTKITKRTPYFTELTDINQSNIGWGREYLPEEIVWGTDLKQLPTEVSALSETAKITDVVKNSGHLMFNIEITEPTIVKAPYIYYKGYVATVNGKAVPVSKDAKGMVTFEVSESGTVEVWYAGTLIQKISLALSSITLIALLSYLFLRRWHRKQLLHHSVDE